MTIRVLVIDDSPTMRAILVSRLNDVADITVVGTASNAAEGREKIKHFNPDVVTLDIEMPGMNGLDFLEKIMTFRPTPVIIISGATHAGNAITARALGLGAVACYSKYDPSGTLALHDGEELAGLVREAAQVRFNAPLRKGILKSVPAVAAQTCSLSGNDTRLIVIGSSTGGVEALQVVLQQFPADCPPTMIVQHVNARFAPAIANTLDQVCPAKVQVAKPDVPMSVGNVYLAATEGHHLMVKGSTMLCTSLRSGELVSGHLPSVDVLFASAAAVVGAGAVGILLTGMGQDGARGLLALHDAGAHTIAQDEGTCTVFGMPRAAISLGAARIIAPINSIARHAFNKAA